ncbi:MAG: DNA topoisomerase VI subunit B [Planctomycetota bacterium]|jgi:DNA topoisomerase-6 subunit B
MTRKSKAKSGNGAAARKPAGRSRATAESLAGQQREISVSEFFAKNRHLLGFDNPRKAMLTTVKEAVDNALDACEEGGLLPDIEVTVLQLGETRFKITIRDNGPGIVRRQIEHIFGKLLYGSKFHRLKMSRGQQGIGISAAGMYGLMTTGKPILIISKTSKKRPAHEVLLKMDTTKNKAVVVKDEEHPEDDQRFAQGHGTEVVIELEGRYQKGRQSIDEYLEQTAIANPHARIIYTSPTNETTEFPRAVEELPAEPREIKPHPKGIELGTLIQMLERTESKKLGAFLQNDFCRVGLAKSKELCQKAGLTNLTWVKQVGHKEAEALYQAIQDVRISAPPTDCLVPIGSKALLAGLLKEVKAEFFAASTRPPAVYRGNPFQIEVAVGFGGELSGDESARVLRFANRVPLLYQQSGCCSFKSVIETGWKNYGLQQPRGSLPVGPLVIMLHMASVWVPFTSESKEAIADYDEIRKEMKLALQECGRKLGTYLRRRKRMKRQSERRTVFERYIGEISRACESITGADAEKLYAALLKQAQRKTAEADQTLDDEGRVVGDGVLERDEAVVIVEERQPVPGGDGEPAAAAATLFGDDRPPPPPRRRAAASKRKTTKRKKKKSKSKSTPKRKTRSKPGSGPRPRSRRS